MTQLMDGTTLEDWKLRLAEAEQELGKALEHIRLGRHRRYHGIVEAGKMLAFVKDDLNHGGFNSWVEAQGIAPSTARRWMQLWKDGHTADSLLAGGGIKKVLGYTELAQQVADEHRNDAADSVDNAPWERFQPPTEHEDALESHGGETFPVGDEDPQAPSAEHESPPPQPYSGEDVADSVVPPAPVVRERSSEVMRLEAELDAERIRNNQLQAQLDAANNRIRFLENEAKPEAERVDLFAQYEENLRVHKASIVRLQDKASAAQRSADYWKAKALE